jgi:hypothetical protein
MAVDFRWGYERVSACDKFRNRLIVGLREAAEGNGHKSCLQILSSMNRGYCVSIQAYEIVLMRHKFSFNFFRRFTLSRIESKVINPPDEN